jgi:copper(I)-binding protein
MLHSSEIVDGVARMHQLDKLVIPAHATVTLEPGGMHLMMPAPEPPLSVGDEVEFELLFGDGSKLAVRAEVRKKP